MRSASKLLSPHPIPRPSSAGLFFSRCKSSLRHPPLASPPSLYQIITEIFPIQNRDTQDVCQNVPASNSTFQTIERGKTRLNACALEEISSVVQKVTEIIRSDNQIPLELRLNELRIVFTPEIVDMVLKRCFKVGSIALRFFHWIKLQPGFCHTTETYNTMAYIAGEAGEFDLMEKLMEDMDADLCLKNIKTWTILISHYANAKKIGKALWTFEEMRKSGCKIDNSVYEAILRGLFSTRKAELAFEFYKEMVLKKLKVDIKIYAMLMDCLSIAGDIGNVRLVAEDMMKIAELPETEVFTIMMRSFCISGNVDEAQKLFEEMTARNMSIDSNG
ncbi:putative pentatricopeptide repeat-containing protein At5g06400, mitochondrial [Phalaenopsis equestris]|uniref:putative pentatricopeptide repeat-containing protein At5g06400, mitochondrial n=1 Tax=Phalaenopsis equestris TaxID=78828 RepID=UPI0009E5116C|nr:putative pentatricopeptide repeat-containing protein At5g06400, mitochondrial [Phalaenopsis equestris]